VTAWLGAHARNVAAAAWAGVRVLAATDAGMVPHGTVAREVALLLPAGLPAEQALAAASWDARRALGFPSLEEGAPADIVVFEEDPRAPRALAKPALTLLDGKVVGKEPAARS
jgi:imidazolonepropionase-like amidohydrolase